MTEPSDRNTGTHHLRRGDFAAALATFKRAIEGDPHDWYCWYGAGQAARFRERLPQAKDFLEEAVRLNPQDSAALLAYGIALQLLDDFDEAKLQFARAIDLDPDFAEAFNSLALTQKRSGELDKALYNYDAGVKAIARRLVKGMRNSEASPIIKHDEVPGEVWLECAMFGGLWLASQAGVHGIVWPTAEAAVDAEYAERHRGLYFIDEIESGTTLRRFLPNYFRSFRHWLGLEPLFSLLVGNQGAVYEAMGQRDIALRRFAEAEVFSHRSS